MTSIQKIINIEEIIADLKFIYSEKATKFCEMSTVNLSYVVPVKSMMEILQTLWPPQNIYEL